MNSLGNRKHSMIAVTMAFVLVSAAFLGLAMIPGSMAVEGDKGNPIWDVAIGATLDIDIDHVYTTTMEQNITITYGWAEPLPVDGHLSELMLNITDGGDYDENLYTWNLTTDGGSPSTEGIYMYNGSLVAGEYTFYVGVLFWNETDQVYSVDIAMDSFMVIDGTDFINSISSDPMTVMNDGESLVNLTIEVDRGMDELDDEASGDFMFWNEDTQMWSDLMVPEIIDDNVTEMDTHFTAFVHMTIPMDLPVGEYYIHLMVVDIWGYEVSYNASVFEVVWYDRPIMPAEDRTVMVEEHVMSAMFNPLDFFYDPDGPIENLAVSIGYNEVVNETNVTVMEPIWFHENESVAIEINQTDFANSMVYILVDVEYGMWAFNITAWVDGEVVAEDWAYIEIIRQNDIPMLIMDTIMVYKNELQTVDLSEYFEDADGPMLNLSVDTNVSGALLVYNWETYMLTINPATNWTGTIDVMINATDGEDYEHYTLTIEVILRSYTITGTVTFESVDTVTVNMSMVELTIGEATVELDENNTFSLTFDEGEYEVLLTVPAMYLYNEDAGQSGYVIPDLENVTLDADQTYDIDVTYMVYESPIPAATWDDINFSAKEMKDEDGTIVITIPVKDVNKTGYGDLTIQLVIKDDDDEYVFNMTWDDVEKEYVLELTEDDLEDIPEGTRQYFFRDTSDHESPVFEYKFNEKDENANLITVIVLIVLIILVLIALVFIMRKPSEEEFDEEDEEEEEEGERSCPSCGETVTNEEANECPYCGENLEE